MPWLCEQINMRYTFLLARGSSTLAQTTTPVFSLSRPPAGWRCLGQHKRISLNHIEKIYASKLCYCTESSDDAKGPGAIVIRPSIFKEIPIQGDRKENKHAFIAVCRTFNEARRRDVYKKGHNEFIEEALARLKDFGGNRDVNCYNAILDMFPKGIFIPENRWQVAMFHFPKQQELCGEVLEHMHLNGVMPNKDTYELVKKTFGLEAHAYRKLCRLMYWMPKFAHANPHNKYVPSVQELDGMPDDALMLAIMILRRMCVDPRNHISVYQTNDLPDASEDTFIASAQAPLQRELLAKQSADDAVFIGGPFTVWMRWKSSQYFYLYANATEATKYQKQEKDEDSRWFDWKIPFSGEQEDRHTKVIVKPSIHEQTDGTILAMCITGTSSLDSLRSWIRFLEKDNPHLRDVPVVFKLKAPVGEVAVIQPDTEKSRQSHSQQKKHPTQRKWEDIYRQIQREAAGHQHNS